MANHPEDHKPGSLTRSLRKMQDLRKKTKPSKKKKGVRVTQPKFSPFEALKLLVSPKK